MRTGESIYLSLQPPPQKPPAPSMPASAPPMKPTFPAYSSTASSSTPPMTPSATISAAPTIKKPESSSGLTIKLVHPHEDISLVCLFVVLVCRWHCRQVWRVEYLFIILKVCLHVTFFLPRVRYFAIIKCVLIAIRIMERKWIRHPFCSLFTPSPLAQC